jgi:hypothetical protein
MRANFKQKNRFVWGAGTDLRNNSLYRVASRQSDLQTVRRAAIAIRIHNLWPLTKTNNIVGVYCRFQFMERLALTDIRSHIGVSFVQILCNLCCGIKLTLRDLFDCEAIVRGRSDIPGHALRVEGLLFCIFG